MAPASASRLHRRDRTQRCAVFVYRGRWGDFSLGWRAVVAGPVLERRVAAENFPHLFLQAVVQRAQYYHLTRVLQICNPGSRIKAGVGRFWTPAKTFLARRACNRLNSPNRTPREGKGWLSLMASAW